MLEARELLLDYFTMLKEDLSPVTQLSCHCKRKQSTEIIRPKSRAIGLSRMIVPQRLKLQLVCRRVIRMVVPVYHGTSRAPDVNCVGRLAGSGAG